MISRLHPVGLTPHVNAPQEPNLGTSHTEFESALTTLLNDRPASAAPELRPLSASKHASARMASRGIALEEEQLQRLAEATDRLEKSGSKEALVVMDDHAFIIGVNKRTLITVMPRQEAIGTLFTHIDATLFIP